MRKKLFLLTLLLCMISLAAGAQTQTIHFDARTVSVREGLEAVRQQSRLGAAFNGRNFDASRTVRLSSDQLSLDAAMKELLNGQDFDYSISDGIIFIEPAKAARQRLSTPSPTTQTETWTPQPRPQPRQIEPQTTAAAVTPQVPMNTNYKPLPRYTLDRGTPPVFGIKTNLLYGIGTLTPNLTAEVGLGQRTTLEVMGSYNPWHRKGSLTDNKKLVHVLLRPEFKYWFCERFNGHFVGVHALFTRFNISQHDIPFVNFKKEYRYDGTGYGVGVSYGYHWMLSKNWGLEFTVGVGAVRLDYDRYDCAACSTDAAPQKKYYFGPTKAGINLTYLIR